MKKTVCALFLCIFCASLFLTGCAGKFDQQAYMQKNAFRLTRQTDESGEISISYVFPVNSEIFLKDCSPEDLQVFKFFLCTYVAALAKQNQDRAVPGMSVGNVTYFEDVDGVGFALKFDDVDAQRKFFGTDQEDDVLPEVKTSGFLMIKTEICSTFPFSEQSANQFKQICVLAVESWCQSRNLESKKFLKAYDDSVFVYDFASTNKQLRSDQFFEGDRFYHNVFVKTQDKLQDSQIVFFALAPNVPVWYALALVTVLVGAAVAYLILRGRKNTKAQKESPQQKSKA